MKVDRVTLTDASEAYGAVTAVMLKNPDMVRACMGIERLDRDDIAQELVRNLFEKSIPKWDETKKVKYQTYLYVCANNHLKNITHKWCRRRVREETMWEYWFNNLDPRAMEGVANEYYREGNYRDGELMQKIMLEVDLDDDEYDLLTLLMTTKGQVVGQGTGKAFAQKMGIKDDRFYKLRKSLFKKIRIRYKITE
jgi:DNA-directed RNA polymerase specialized sigma24 family protein